MDTPWKSHVDSMAKTLVKTRKRVKPKVEVEIRNETLDSKDNKVNKDSKTKTGSGKSLTSPVIKMNTSKKNDTFNESKKEKEITVTQVDKHTKPKTDPMIDTIRKEKEIEKKQKIQQLQRLKEIQEEEDIQRRQMKKLQAEMKSKPFV